MTLPQQNEYPALYQNYIDLVKGNNILKTLKNQVLDIQALISQIPEEKESYAYAAGKWTIKEVLGHIIDTERVLGYRAMRFARKDKTPLPSFDENLYIENGNFDKQTLYSLAHEFAIVREANLAMFKRKWFRCFASWNNVYDCRTCSSSYAYNQNKIFVGLSSFLMNL